MQRGLRELLGWRVWWFNVLSGFISCYIYHMYIYIWYIYIYIIYIYTVFIFMFIYIPPFPTPLYLWFPPLSCIGFGIAKVSKCQGVKWEARASWLETYRCFGGESILGALWLKPCLMECTNRISLTLFPHFAHLFDKGIIDGIIFKSLGSVVGFRYVGVFFPNTIPCARIWTSFLVLLLGCVQCTKEWSDPEQYQWSLARG